MNCSCDYILPSREDWEQHYGNCKMACGDSEFLKNDDGTMKLKNKQVLMLDYDVLYHLGFDTRTHNLSAMFGDVKFVCMGGTKYRMKELAKHLCQVLDVKCDFVNLVKEAHRYAMYKVGPVLCVSHGIGIPSMTVVLEEVIKMMYYAKAIDPIFIRIGTCGGLGIPPGHLVIANWGLNGALEKSYDMAVLGKIRKYPTTFDKRLCQELASNSHENDAFKIFRGGTMAADDFYRGEARTDGASCDYTESDKMEFLRKLTSMGVVNIEMEATAFAAVTSDAGLRAADVCVTLLDRMQGDQLTMNKEALTEWQQRPMLLVGRYICKYYKK